jgi:uracil-DNA glycosylase
MSVNDDRIELAGLVRSLRAYVALHEETGTTGFPRGQRAKPHHVEQATSLEASGVAAPQTVRSASELVEATPRHVLLDEPSIGPAPELSSQASSIVAAKAPTRSLPIVLTDLAKEVAQCMQCELGSTRTQTVFARGPEKAELMVIGEAPGADEDAQGVPFVGKAGQLLDRMLTAMGIEPSAVYVCNIIKCRPPGNRRPLPEEITQCMPYLRTQIETVAPRVIIAMGNTAIGALLGANAGVSRVRGQWKLYRGKIPVMPTFHPSYLLRVSPEQQEAKKQVWQDLQLVMKELGLAPPKKS